MRNVGLTLVGLDIDGAWNVPLLRSAAEMSGASMVFARMRPAERGGPVADQAVVNYADLFEQYDHVVACETGTSSRNIYTFPAPRGRTAVLVGNEMSGISREALRKTRKVVTVPMHGTGMTSVNVAVAGAIVLYVLRGDLARTGRRRCRLTHANVDVLVRGPNNPSELGSFFRSVWAFGWRRVYLSDRNSVWFTQDRDTVIAGRAAARRERNPIVIASDDQIRFDKYKSIILCSNARSGTPLSRCAMPDHGPVLIVLGGGENPPHKGAEVKEVYVDFGNSKARPCFRHIGSILLSVVSEMLRGTRRG